MHQARHALAGYALCKTLSPAGIYQVLDAAAKTEDDGEIRVAIAVERCLDSRPNVVCPCSYFSHASSACEFDKRRLKDPSLLGVSESARQLS